MSAVALNGLHVFEFHCNGQCAGGTLRMVPHKEYAARENEQQTSSGRGFDESNMNDCQLEQK